VAAIGHRHPEFGQVIGVLDGDQPREFAGDIGPTGQGDGDAKGGYSIVVGGGEQGDVPRDRAQLVEDLCRLVRREALEVRIASEDLTIGGRERTSIALGVIGGRVA
jgi:predicted RNA-binding protein with TRAM domain